MTKEKAPCFISALVLLAAAASALAADPPAFVKPTLVPGPRSAEYRLDSTFSLAEGFAVSVSCPEDGAAVWISSHVPVWFGVTPRVTSAAESSVPEDEGFELSVDERGVSVSAKRLVGVKYAMYAFRQMAVPCRGTETLSGWEMPFARIADSPKMSWRGFHFCCTRNFKPSDVEHFLRMAAYYRYNYFVLEDHGGFKYEKYPWYSFADAKMTAAELRRLKAIADDLGISLVPAVNCYGHSAKAPEGGFEHVALDDHPEFQPLFEPDYGWNWCVTNPEARKVVKGILAELLDVFGGPRYVHLGFDEAHPPSCRNCAAGELYRHVADYLGDLAGFLRERGATAMVWHDQFLVKGDPQWEGFVHEGSKDAGKLLEAIPKDIIICDWYYNDGRDDYPTLTYFRNKGFRVFTSPWGAVSSWASQKNGGGFTQVAWAVDHGFDGAMVTTWGCCDREDRDRELLAADFMWGHPFKAARDYLMSDNEWRWTHRYVATHWRQIGWDMLREGEKGKDHR
ncbi:MAG: family 20 glycosylhydrolase [Kiritimatiellae bacterium]|nr:family 20 glycosylhydrolase [Kiritimatiellia bacterium]